MFEKYYHKDAEISNQKSTYTETSYFGLELESGGIGLALFKKSLKKLHINIEYPIRIINRL